jgi:iron complex transport system substrate-binding protein
MKVRSRFMKILSVIFVILCVSGNFSTTSFAAVSDINASEISLPIIPISQTGFREIPRFKRVVALANGSAEIVAALGYKSILVGRDIASTMPELASIPIDESAMQVSPESVLSHHPDLIFIDSNTSPANALTTFRKAKIPLVMVPGAFTMNDIYAKESAIANALGVPKAGAALEKQLSRLHFPSSRIKVVFLYLRGTASIYLIGGKGSGADSILSTLGFIDVGANKFKIPFNAMTAEELVKLQPDVILLMSKGLASVGGIDGLVQIPGIAQISAGIHRRVVTVDDSLLLSFGPRTVTMMKKLRPLIVKAASRP